MSDHEKVVARIARAYEKKALHIVRPEGTPCLKGPHERRQYTVLTHW